MHPLTRITKDVRNAAFQYGFALANVMAHNPDQNIGDLEYIRENKNELAFEDLKDEIFFRTGLSIINYDKMIEKIEASLAPLQGVLLDFQELNEKLSKAINKN